MTIHRPLNHKSTNDIKVAHASPATSNSGGTPQHVIPARNHNPHHVEAPPYRSNGITAVKGVTVKYQNETVGVQE